VRKTTLILSCLSLFPAYLAEAQPVAQSQSIAGDISQFHGDKNTLINALQATEKASGGKVIDIRFSYPNGIPTYNAVVVKGSQVQFFKINEPFRNVAELDANSKPVWMLNRNAKADVHYAQQATVPLTKAIQVAEQAGNGAPAMAAGIARSASNPDSDVQAYTVLLNVAGTVRSVSLDISTGQMIADPSTLKY